MRVKRIAPIRHVPILIHDIVPMPSTIRLANTTEVDVGDSVWVCRDQDIVLVLKRNASLFSDRLFFFTPFSVCRLQFIEPILERLGTSIKLSLCLLKFSLCTFVLCFGGIKNIFSRTKVIFCILESWFTFLKLITSRSNFFNQSAPFIYVSLRLFFIAMPLSSAAYILADAPSRRSYAEDALSNACFIF